MKLFVTGFALIVSQAVLAQALKPEWELGSVGLATSQQAYPGSSYQQSAALIAPLLIYRGGFLRASQGGLGLRAVDLPNFEMDIGFAGAFGSNSSKILARRGMPNLGNTVEFGPRVKWYLNGRYTDTTSWVEVPIRAVFDVSHHPTNIGFTVEPQWAYETNIKSWTLSSSVGLLLGSTALNQHFYTVDSKYANSEREPYQARAGSIAWKLGLSASYQVTPAFSWFAYARLNTTNHTRNQTSPLIDKTAGVSSGIGFMYSFLQSNKLVKP